MNTRVVAADRAGIALAAALIRAGEVVAVPSETVYGLAADAGRGDAVARIYAAKGRPSFNPLIVHVADREAGLRIASFSPAADALARAFWPGPLTLVLPRLGNTAVSALATAGLSTVALRVPAHPVMQALIAAAGRPLAAPSANASGRISATCAGHVMATLGGRIPLVLDGGDTAHGLESTIVAPGADRLRLLRPGPIDIAALERAGGLAVMSDDGAGGIEAPGQLASHYAPAKPLRLDAIDRISDEWLIGFGAVVGDDTLSARGDPIEAAARLFGALHRADASPCAGIAVAPVPGDGIALAIRDRLTRAAAPR